MAYESVPSYGQDYFLADWDDRQGFLYTGETYEFASPYTGELKRYECDGNGVLDDGEYEGYEWAEFSECYDGSCDPDDLEGPFVLFLR